MTAVTHPPVRVEDWDAMVVPEGYKAEIVQGEIIVTPAADIGHGRALTRLIITLSRHCPPGWEPMTGPEWRVAVEAVVAMAPVPDVVVVPVDAEGAALTEAPLLAVEVISPSDRRRLANGLTRREGKLLDYAGAGLDDYLEVDLAAPGGPYVFRYERQGDALVAVAQAVGDETLESARPFPYRVCLTDLVARR